MSVVHNVKRLFPQVTMVVDSTRPATIEVTEKDAQSKGIKKHAECAMAVACKRKFHLDGVIISRSIAYLIKGKKARRFKMPESAVREVVSFDRGAGFQPGVYKLDPIPKSAIIGSRKDRAKQLVKNRGAEGPRRKYHITENVRKHLGAKA